MGGAGTKFTRRHEIPIASSAVPSVARVLSFLSYLLEYTKFLHYIGEDVCMMAMKIRCAPLAGSALVTRQKRARGSANHPCALPDDRRCRDCSGGADACDTGGGGASRTADPHNKKVPRLHFARAVTIDH